MISDNITALAVLAVTPVGLMHRRSAFACIAMRQIMVSKECRCEEEWEKSEIYRFEMKNSMEILWIEGAPILATVVQMSNILKMMAVDSIFGWKFLLENWIVF